MKIRLAKLEDKEKVNKVHVRSIREMCAKDYSEEQIKRWSDVRYTDEVWSNTVNVNCCYVVEKESEIFGFCHAMVHKDGQGEIVGLYFTPEIVGQGMGRKVFEKCLDYLRQKNCKKVFLYSTKTAKNFYQTMGFELLAEKIVPLRGTHLESYHMEMNL